MELDQFVADVVKRGYGEIDFTQPHTSPAPKEIAEFGIRRDGDMRVLTRCLDCRTPISVGTGERFFCGQCIEFRSNDGEDDEEVQR